MAYLDQQTHYTITIEGSIDPSLADWCGPLTITTAQGADGTQTTQLTGILADQAGIVGLIRHLHGLGVVLLCIERCTLPRPAGA